MFKLIIAAIFLILSLDIQERECILITNPIPRTGNGQIYTTDPKEDQAVKKYLKSIEDRKDEIGIPEQVHISYGLNGTQMMITWITFEMSTNTGGLTPIVQYGQSELNHKSFGYATAWMNGNRTSFVNRVMLNHLKPDVIYLYRCGNEQNQIWSKTFKFRSKPENEEEWSPKIALFGDMGLVNGRSIPYLNERSKKMEYDVIFHSGDIAYNLHELNGKLGDEFMRKMEPAISTIPYQTAVGNHEWFQNFTHYTNRYTMTDSLTGDQNNYYYSFNVGPVHFISISSEFYFWYLNQGEFPSHDIENIKIQYEWLKRDLIEANRPENRRKRPWIIVAAHRAMYCSTVDVDDCSYNESILRKGIPIVYRWGLEDILYEYGVDMYIGAHEHTYERLFPIYNRRVYNGSLDNPYRNPKAPVHFLVGSGGCRELVDPFINHPAPWSAKRISDYGITELHVMNKTHIRIQQRSTHNVTDLQTYGKIVDSILLVKERHGKEAWF